MRPTLLLLCGFLLHMASPMHAQTVTGKVVGVEGETITGANVYWQETDQGVLTDKQGQFSIARPDTGHFHLITHITGLRADTSCNDSASDLLIQLQAIQTADVEIRDTRQGMYIGMDARKTEVITRTELEKDACCDLAGCFNTQASVEARTTNVLTNAKELQVLGLAGVYNQLLLEGMPLFRGASFTYGVSGVPGPAIDKIYVAKGAGSILQGFESVTGQINVIPLDPNKAQPLMFNIYGNSFLEQQYNAHYAHRARKWSMLLSAHSAQPGMAMDRDDDGFRDMPWLRRYHVLNKWQYRDDDSLGFSAAFGFRLLDERREGGQILGHNHGGNTADPYIQRVDYGQQELWTRLNFRQTEFHKTTLQIAGQRHDQRSAFGRTNYKALQNLLYVNAEHAFIWRERQQLKAGLSYRQLDLDEDIGFTTPDPPKSFGGQYLTQERIPGVFAENTSYLFQERVTLIAGFRADWHNQYGWFLTPRGLLKWDIGHGFTSRLSAGSSYRTVLLFTENLNLLASGRDVIFEENLEPERAYSIGFNLDKTMDLDPAKGRVGVDIYRTRFQNQFFPDYDRDPGYAFIGNFDGQSEGWGLQAETAWELWGRMEFRFAYNYLDVYRVVNEQRENLPFIAKHKLVGVYSIWTKGRRFHFDLNAHWYGRQRLPKTDNHPAGFELPAYSQTYFLLNSQVAYKLDKQGVWDVYFGCENILDFRQLRPIAGWQDPFGRYFDPSFAWGPTRGQEFYAGVRIHPALGKAAKQN